MAEKVKTLEVGPGLHFHLRPFTTGPLVERLSLSGFIVQSADSLLIEYKLQGPLKCIKWPSILPADKRCHDLWRHTCFELFFGIQGDASYWEMNLSPSGCWNIYSFDNYRDGMREDRTIGSPVCRIISDTDSLSLSCSLGYNSIINNDSPIEIGLCSVVEGMDGSTSYWAIEHHGAEPDFHDRRSFKTLK
ncbi:MAG: DOMON-like domain-containing protein [Desulforhopalus sp.]